MIWRHLDPSPLHECKVGCDGSKIFDLIREQRDQWRDSRGEVVPPWMINCGDCADFAERLVRIMTDHGVTSALVVDTDWFGKGDYHAWVYYRGKHYDSEVPEGVHDWECLPFFGRAGERGENVTRHGKTVEDLALKLAVKMMTRCRDRLMLEGYTRNAENEAAAELAAAESDEEHRCAPGCAHIAPNGDRGIMKS